MMDRIKLTENDLSIWEDMCWTFEVDRADSKQDMKDIRKQILENQEKAEKYDDLMKANSEIV